MVVSTSKGVHRAGGLSVSCTHVLLLVCLWRKAALLLWHAGGSAVCPLMVHVLETHMLQHLVCVPVKGYFRAACVVEAEAIMLMHIVMLLQ